MELCCIPLHGIGSCKTQITKEPATLFQSPTSFQLLCHSGYAVQLPASRVSKACLHSTACSWQLQHTDSNGACSPERGLSKPPAALSWWVCCAASCKQCTHSLSA